MSSINWYNWLLIVFLACINLAVQMRNNWEHLENVHSLTGPFPIKSDRKANLPSKIFCENPRIHIFNYLLMLYLVYFLLSHWKTLLLGKRVILGYVLKYCSLYKFKTILLKIINNHNILNYFFSILIMTVRRYPSCSVPHW